MELTVEGAQLWAAQHPWSAALLAALVVASALGHLPRPSAAFAARWPRLALLYVACRQGGAVVFRMLRPIVGLVAPPVMKAVLDEWYGVAAPDSDKRGGGGSPS